MTETEEYFPRGGKKPVIKQFKQVTNFLGAGVLEKKAKKSAKKKPEGDDGYLSDDIATDFDQSYKNCAVGISYKTAKEGLLILGRVRQIQETKLYVTLPCKMSGVVMACHISKPYNRLLEDYVNDKVEKVPELQQMFRVGQYVAVKVLEVKGRQLMLSMMPNHLCEGRSHQDLHNGALLQAAVSSVEDHGYVMDIGIPNTRAFLPKENANPEVELDVGYLSWCCVKSLTLSPESSSSVVTLTSELESLQCGVQRKKNNAPLLPGTAVDFIVDKPLENGIEGHILDKMTSYIQRHHADSVKGKKPNLGQRVRARILYVMPTRNNPFLIMRNIFETTYPDLQQEQKLQEGDIVEGAQVIKIQGRSVHFRLGKGSVGVMGINRLQVHEDMADEDIVAKSYPLGSVHKVRVLCYNLGDYFYSVSDQPEVVNERYFRLEQLHAGDIVDGIVATVSDNSLTINVGRLTGFVPQTHTSDSGIFVDPKKAMISKLHKKKFKEGQKVKARVLNIDLAKQTLVLTLKPTLLKPDLEILDSYEKAQVGASYTGVIRKICDYILVSFFNNVTAYVPKIFVTKEQVTNFNDLFHVGQIVTCTVIKLDAEANKMSASFITAPFDPSVKRQKATKRKSETVEEKQPKRPKSSDDEEEDVQQTKGKKKKQKSDIESENVDKKNKKQKSKDSDCTSELVIKKDKKKSVPEALSEEKPKKKNKKDKSELKNDDEEETGVSKKKRKAEDNEVNVKSNKKDKKMKEEIKTSEESDAIETDIQDPEVLTPQDLGLIDISDCTTIKECKKRVMSIIKSINARGKRLKTVNRKIDGIEEKGLNAKTKKYHTAMHTEKLVVEERIQKLTEALKSAQDKLKELGLEEELNINKKLKVKEKTISNSSDTTDKKHAKLEKKEKVKDSETKIKISKGESRKDKISKIKVVESLEPALEIPSAKDFWTAADEETKNLQEDSPSSSNDEEEEQPKKKRKKLTPAEKVAKAREEEERIRQMERAAVESESQPRSVDQFERALLATPNCSQLWIAYMAFHLQATEIDKARAVGRKALNTINFREEDEKLNVWLAMLNFEHRFGTKESQQKTLEEALQTNDTYKVHSKLLDIYVETSKQAELLHLVDLMMKKYKREPKMYIACGEACFKSGLVDKARHVMQKAVSVLEKKEHVSVLVQFALMERADGNRERAEALFEQILAVYPQRVDVCSVYVDMLVKNSDVDTMRHVMERMISQKLPARKMKTLFKKWIEVEEKFGDKDRVENIRQRAMEFIEKAKF